MAYNELLAERVAEAFDKNHVPFNAKKMMGGLCYMVDDKMCVGVEKERLMVRLDPDYYEKALARKGCKPMDFTGRPMKGFVYVDASGIGSDSDLAFWISKALEFNPKAKSSKRKGAQKKKPRPAQK